MFKETFAQQMRRLEVLYNDGRELPAEQTQEYWVAFKDTVDSMFVAAVDEVRQRHRPHYGERFPSVAAMFDVLDDVARNPAIVERIMNQGTQFCQLCENLGMFLDDDQRLRFCVCAAGERRREVWRVKPGSESSEYRSAFNSARASAPPVSGIKEYNASLKVWEPTKAEHERWMAKARARLEAIRARRAKGRAGIAAVVNQIMSRDRQFSDADEDAPADRW